jgi:AcrR family transcriptional regulator
MLGIVPSFLVRHHASVKAISDLCERVLTSRYAASVPPKKQSKPARRRSSADSREHVLNVAKDLFYWHGIRAVGVDRVAAEAGIAPTTLYRLFDSKEDLVDAYLERADTAYRAWFDETTRRDGRSPSERILALFDGLIEQVQPDRCRGCPFLIALTEFPDADVSSHRKAAATKVWVRARFDALAAELAATHPVADPSALADHLMLLFEGVYATVPALGAAGPARRVRALVEALLSTATAQKKRTRVGRDAY